MNTDSSLRITVTSVLVAALGFAGGCGGEAAVERHLKRGGKFLGEERYKEAIIEYMNVLRRDPTNRVAVQKLGAAYAAAGDVRASIPFVLKSAELEPDNMDAQLQAGRIYLLMGKAAAAQKIARRIVDVAPEGLSAHVLLAESARGKQQVGTAAERLDAAADRFKDEAAFHAARARLYIQGGKLDAAEQALQTALNLDSDSGVVHQLLGLVYGLRGDKAQAEDAFQTAVDLETEGYAAAVTLARFRIASGDASGGREVLETVVANHPTAMGALLELAKLDFSERKFMESRDRVDQLLKIVPDNLEALLLRGRTMLLTGQQEEALEALDSLANRFPESPRIQYEIALARVSSGDVRAALPILSQLVKKSPGFVPGRLLLAETQLRLGYAEAAIGPLEELLAKAPNLEKAHVLLGSALQVLGRHREAADVFRRVAEAQPDKAVAQYRLGRALVRQGAAKEARSVLEKALSLEPGFMAPLSVLVTLDLRDDRPDEAIARIQQRVEQDPDSAKLRYLLGAVHLRQDHLQDAETAFRDAIERDSTLLGAYVMLGRLFAKTGRVDEALAEVERALEVNPRSIRSLTLGAVLHGRAGRDKQAADLYERILAINPVSVPALNNLAYLYATDLDDLERAHELAAQARKVAPDNPYVADTAGWVAYLRGEHQWALTAIEAAVDGLQGQAEVQYHLGMAYLSLGRETDAAEALGHALAEGTTFDGGKEATATLRTLQIPPHAVEESHREALQGVLAAYPENAAARFRLGALAQKQNQPRKAVQLYEQVLATFPSFAPALLRLAQLQLDEFGDPGKAIEFARQARDLLPDDPEVIALVGWVAFCAGDHEWAKGLLQQAADARPDDALVQYRYGLVTLATGDLVGGREHMDRALVIDPGFPDAASARRSLAMIDLASGNSTSAEALSQALGVLKEDPKHIPALYAAARIHARRRELAEATAMYEAAIKEYPGFAPGARELASLYFRSDSNQKRAYKLASQARQAMDDDPQAALVLGKIVYRREEYAYAAQLLEEATVTIKDDAEAFYLLGIAQHELKKKAKSDAALRRALELDPESSHATRAKQLLNESD